MKLEKFEEKNHKKKITIGITVILVLLVAGIIVYRSFAFYEEKKAFDVIKGQVPDQNYDLMFSFYVKDENENMVYQETMPEGKDYTVTIECNNGATGEWDNESWGPRIVNLTSTRTKCKIIFEDKAKLTDSAKIGDYVYYKPSITSYTTNASYVGGSSYTKTINPSELTLWRIIKKNKDGTIEIVSENTSSTVVTFFGEVGYKNFVGQLNLIAKQYEDTNYTVRSRHIGYSNQEEFITTFDANYNSDEGYKVDFNLVQETLGTLAANKIGATTPTNYWMSSRGGFMNETYVAVFYNSEIPYISSTILYCSYCDFDYNSHAVRPILTLKSGLYAKGDGTKDNPWKVN